LLAVTVNEPLARQRLIASALSVSTGKVSFVLAVEAAAFFVPFLPAFFEDFFEVAIIYFLLKEWEKFGARTFHC
jgi:hypothetical protein